MIDWFFIVFIYVGQTLVYSYSSDIEYATQAECELEADDHASFRVMFVDRDEAVVEATCFQVGEMVP